MAIIQLENVDRGKSVHRRNETGQNVAFPSFTQSSEASDRHFYDKIVDMGEGG